MRRILLALVTAASFALTVGISPVSTTTEARPWVGARVAVRAAPPYYRPYYRSYRPYYGSYRPYYGYYRPYYGPYYSGYSYYW